MKLSEKIEALKQNEYLKALSDHDLEWLIVNSEERVLEPGEMLFSKGDQMLYMHMILRGRIQIFLDQNGARQVINTIDTGSITGVLPYSRMKMAMANGQALLHTIAHSLPRDKFIGLDQISYQLMQTLVSLMTERVRDFTAQQQQNEKLISLGKLSAGLAHELNNPAAAMVRSSSALKKHLSNTPERFKAVIKIQMDDASIDIVNELLFSKTSKSRPAMSLIEKNSREDQMADWLIDKGINEPYQLAENFVLYGFELQDLEMVASKVPPEHLNAVLQWMENVLTTESMVNEIEEASKRISTLVNSVKSYSHMDKGTQDEPVHLLEGIQSTLAMMAYKIKQKKIMVDVSTDDNIPPIVAKPGQLNQVWTNLIDNAIDAMSEGGTLKIQLRSDHSCTYAHVIDDGSGIPEEIQNKIFDPFFTTKDVGKGTGLGLDISMKIVRAIGGNIQLNSRPGKTEFIVNLPSKV